MPRRQTFTFAVGAALASQVAMFSSPAALAQSASDVVGTWSLVSSVTERDGTTANH